MEKQDIMKTYNYKDDWEREIERKMYNYQIRHHEKANIIINLIIAFLVFFVFKLPTWIAVIAFLIFDVICVGINVYLVRIVPELIKAKSKNKNFLEKRNNILRKEIEKQQKLLSKKLKHYPAYNRSAIRADIDGMESEILKNEKLIKEMVEEENIANNVYKQIEKENKNNIQTTIDMLINLKLSNTMKDYGISLTEVKDKTKQIVKLLEEKPEGIEAASTSICLYGRELINIIEDVKSMDKEDQEEYFDKIKLVIEEYYKHLDRLEDRIKKENYIKTNVDINVLLDEITKDK